MHGDVPIPKVIDFGIAKAMHQDLTDKTLFTRFEQFIGTPAYMSPEQTQMSGLDVDTRSDIYSLGVLLYEMLSGKLPFDPATLKEAAMDRVWKIIREEEPPWPSTKVSAMSEEELTTVARHRQLEPDKLRKLLHGELDWIVMKAMSKDRKLRYESAASFSQDIERFLQHEPIVAAAPSALYRAKKFARKHRLAVSTSLTIVGALLIAGVVSAISAFMLSKQLDRTKAAEAKALDAVQHLWLKTGEDYLEENDPTGAVLPFIRALEVEGKKEATLQDDSIHRLRIGSVLRLCPRIVEMWFEPAMVNSVSFAGEHGDTIVSGGNSSEVRRYHLGSTDYDVLAEHRRAAQPEDAQSAFIYRNTDAAETDEFLLSAGDDGRVFFRALNRQETTTEINHDKEAVSARLSVDRRQLLTGCYDGLATALDCRA